MKAFRFRLDQALRWRRTQLDLEKSRAAAAAAKISGIRAEIEACRRARATSGPHPSPESSGLALEMWGAFADRTARRLRELQRALADAERALADLMPKVLAANRNVKLLENLRDDEKLRWQAGLSRELEASAAEAHLFRLHAAGRSRADTAVRETPLHAIQSELDPGA